MNGKEMTCPSCDGRGKSYAHLDYGGKRGGEWKWVNCLTCGGSGTITPETLCAIEVGRRLRERRKAAPYRTQREQGLRLGISAAELSQAEAGRLPLTRIREIEAMVDKLESEGT